jgi:hypothetical protein
VLNTINFFSLSYINSIHYKKLIFIVFIQYLLRFALCIPLGANLMLNNFYFNILVIATTCIAAGGLIINQSYTVSTIRNQLENQVIDKRITKKNAYCLFVILNVLGVVIGFIITNHVEQPDLFGFFIVFSALFYLYASFISNIPIFNNILISILAIFPLLIVGIIDLLPAITSINQSLQTFVFSIILNYSFFLFFVCLIRALVHDIVFIDENKKGNRNTLSIWIGIKRTSYIIFFLVMVFLFAIIYYNYTVLYKNTVAVIYSLFFVLAPLLLLSVKVWESSNKIDFKFPLKLLDFVLFFSACSLFLFLL